MRLRGVLGRLDLYAFFPVALSASAAFGQVPQRDDLVLELRIGSTDAEEYSLTQVADLEVGPDGKMYVLQPVEKLVRVFDSRGLYLGAIGGPGEGPGEFRWPVKLGWYKDTLWVWDAGQNRLSLFRGDGVFTRSIFVPQSAVAALLSDGSVVIQPRLQGEPLGKGLMPSVPLVRLDLARQVTDTIAEIALGNVSFEIVVDGKALFGYQPFADNTLWMVLPDGRAVFTVDRKAASKPGAADFRVTKLDASGDTLFSVLYWYKPRRLNQRVLNTAIAELIDRMTRTGRSGLARGAIREKAVRDALYQPEYLPPVTALVAGLDDMLWLRQEDVEGEFVTWSVADARGAIVSIVKAPKRLIVFRAGRGFVWGVEKAEAGMSHVVRYGVR